MGPIAVLLLAGGAYLIFRNQKDKQEAEKQAAINQAVANPTAEGMMANALAPSNVDVGALEQIAQWFDQKGLPRYASIVRLKKQYLLTGQIIDQAYFLRMIQNPGVPIQ